MYLDLEGRNIEAPKARSLAAIRRSQITALHATKPNTLDDFKMRAFQYVCWRYDVRETKFRDNTFDWRRRGVSFEIDGVFVDGKLQKRIRAVMFDGQTYNIPNWDFVPQDCETA